MKNRVTALLAATVIPLSSPQGWKGVEFRGIPANKVAHAADGLQVEVDRSSSPLVYKLDKPARVKAIRALLEIEGTIRPTPGWPEDAYLRLGLVIPGKRKLSWFERRIAPRWVTELFRLAPADAGIDKIEFFNVVPKSAKIGASRVFPKSRDLMVEHLIAARADEKVVRLEYVLPQAREVAALWLSVDGDDTKSRFRLKLKSLELD